MRLEPPSYLAQIQILAHENRGAHCSPLRYPGLPAGVAGAQAQVPSQAALGLAEAPSAGQCKCLCPWQRWQPEQGRSAARHAQVPTQIELLLGTAADEGAAPGALHVAPAGHADLCKQREQRLQGPRAQVGHLPA